MSIKTCLTTETRVSFETSAVHNSLTATPATESLIIMFMKCLIESEAIYVVIVFVVHTLYVRIACQLCGWVGSFESCPAHPRRLNFILMVMFIHIHTWNVTSPIEPMLGFIVSLKDSRSWDQTIRWSKDHQLFPLCVQRKYSHAILRPSSDQ